MVEDSVEREIVERAAAAKLRLRFDKVVVRVVGRLKAALSGIAPEGEAIIFTLTAPIRLPGKTAVEMERMAREGSPGGEVHGNQVRIRRLTGLPANAPKVLGFVHNPESDAETLLDIAEGRLRG